jgi:hypothetical protein
MTSEQSDAFADALKQRLDDLAESERSLAFWWRDDDAVAATPRLDRLLGLAAEHALPVALAVIPVKAEPSLRDRLDSAPDVVALQHGYAHVNHEPPGNRASEVGDARPLDTVLDELQDGRRRLEDLFADRFLPVLTPPWNRISSSVAARRGEAGLPGLSTFGAASPDFMVLDTHLDPIAWRTTRGFHGFERMLRLIDDEIARRELIADPAPIGLLTHHLAHDDGVWEFVETLIAVTARHPAARWQAVGEVLGLGDAAPRPAGAAAGGRALSPE